MQSECLFKLSNQVPEAEAAETLDNACVASFMCKESFSKGEYDKALHDKDNMSKPRDMYSVCILEGLCAFDSFPIQSSH